MNRKFFAVLFALATILSLATNRPPAGNTNNPTVVADGWGSSGDWGCLPCEVTVSGNA